MSHLLDVNFLLACAWRSHADHRMAPSWLEKQASFSTCSISQLGLLRVSLSPGYRASSPDALEALREITTHMHAHVIADDLSGEDIAAVSSHSEVTAASLVALSRAYGLKLTTLDRALCEKP